MTSNHKLTAVLKGRTITGMQNQDHQLIIAFDDGSTMTVNTSGSTTSAPTGGTIAKVRQQSTQLALDFEDGATMLIHLAEATSSVMVRAKDGTLEYAD
jgi:phosphotransferase system IIA component